jgi:hypothetical protein
MAGARACRRLPEIIWRCEILQPVTPYQLAIGDVVITGAYAVLRSSRRKKHAFALYLRDGGVKLKRLVLDLVSFARRLDLGDRWLDVPPANAYLSPPLASTRTTACSSASLPSSVSRNSPPPPLGHTSRCLQGLL